MSYTVELRNGIPVLVGDFGCCPATDAEAWFAQRCRELESERDALEAKCERLKSANAQWLVPDFPPRPPDGEGLPRYGLRWNGPQRPLSVPMADGYWTPWHLAHAEVEALRAKAQRAHTLFA